MVDEKFHLNISLKTAEGLPVPDEEWVVDIKDVSSNYARQLRATSRGGRVHGDVLMPNPIAALHCEYTSQRFHPQASEFFFPKEGGMQKFEATVFRRPGEWSPSFAALATLPSPRFDSFRNVLSKSDRVDLMSGVSIGDLHDSYDGLGGEQAVLAKMALLNLHSVLLDEQDPLASLPWFSHVKRILRIDRERIIAEVQPDLYENVQTIIRDIGQWSRQGFFLEASTILHGGNLPVGLPPLAAPSISVKKEYQQGNLQLTLSFLRGAGQVLHVLDCDLDEHANLVAHTADIFKHEFTKGTAPVEMHDFIALHSATQQPDRVSKCELGYTLS